MEKEKEIGILLAPKKRGISVSELLTKLRDLGFIVATASGGLELEALDKGEVQKLALILSVSWESERDEEEEEEEGPWGFLEEE